MNFIQAYKINSLQLECNEVSDDISDETLEKISNDSQTYEEVEHLEKKSSNRSPDIGVTGLKHEKLLSGTIVELRTSEK